MNGSKVRDHIGVAPERPEPLIDEGASLRDDGRGAFSDLSRRGEVEHVPGG